MYKRQVYNRTPGKDRALVEARAIAVAAPQDIGDVDVLITCVADGPAEDETIINSGLIDRLPKECIHVSCTTLGVDTARKLTAEHNKRGRAFVAAPVLGRAVDMAPAGKLFVIAAGPPDAIARCMPLFEAVGQRTFTFGPDPANAIAVKLAVNFICLLYTSVIRTEIIRVDHRRLQRIGRSQANFAAALRLSLIHISSLEIGRAHV